MKATVLAAYSKRLQMNLDYIKTSDEKMGGSLELNESHSVEDIKVLLVFIGFNDIFVIYPLFTLLGHFKF